jgi:hypothetical protein
MMTIIIPKTIHSPSIIEIDDFYVGFFYGLLKSSKVFGDFATSDARLSCLQQLFVSYYTLLLRYGG